MFALEAPALVAETAISLDDYAAGWMTRNRPRTRPRTQHTYAFVLARYVLPSLGAYALTALCRPDLVAWLEALAARGLSAGTIRLAVSVLSAILSDAVDNGILSQQPAARLTRRYRVRRPSVPTYNTQQRTLFLDTAAEAEPDLAPCLATLALAGLRVGEVRAVQGGDCDLDRCTLRVDRQLHRDGRIAVPKGGCSRTVDLCEALAGILAPRCMATRGWLWPALVTESGYRQIRDVMARVATAAGLTRVPPKSLRHSFASILISDGESPEYVRRQLGHSDIRLTVQTYGDHLPMQRPASYGTRRGEIR